MVLKLLIFYVLIVFSYSLKLDSSEIYSYKVSFYICKLKFIVENDFIYAGYAEFSWYVLYILMTYFTYILKFFIIIFNSFK